MIKSKCKILIYFLLISSIFSDEIIQGTVVDEQYVILVSFDGFRYDYIERVDTPNFDYIEKGGVKAKSLKPIFPSFTFPNHYSIATGCYVDKHKIIGNEFNTSLGQYSYKNRDTVQDARWYGAEPIWVTAEKNGIITATYFWVGSEAKIGGYYPTYYKYYEFGIDPIVKVNQVIDWLKLPIKQRPKLIYLYFNEPDHAGHEYGTNSEEVNKQIKISDDVLGYLLESIKKLNIYDKINIVIVSDHGMVDVSDDKVINIDDFNISGIVHGKGPMMSIKETEINSINLEDITIPHVTIVSAKNNNELHYHNPIYDFLLIADEASGVPEGVFEAASGSMSGESACTILLGNPVRSTGMFYNTHNKLSDYWKTLKVSCIDSPRVSEDYVEDMKLRYSESSNAFRVRVLGEFPVSDDDTIIPREMVESAIDRGVKGVGGAVVLGVDVARRGKDASAICIRQGNHVLGREVLIRKKLDTMQVVGWIESEMKNLTSSGYEVGEVLIDSIGLGAGVVDRLIEKGVDVRGINVSESPSVGSEYFNLRSELWWRCRDWFERRDCLIPNDERLLEELVTVQQDYNSDKLKVESKEKTRRNLDRGSSPDAADAFVLTFASYASMSQERISWKKPLEREMLGIV